MIKIARNKAAQRGQKTVGTSLPSLWIEENKVKVGDELDIYRGEVPGVGKDCLVIKNPDENLEKPKE